MSANDDLKRAGEAIAKQYAIERRKGYEAGYQAAKAEGWTDIKDPMLSVDERLPELGQECYMRGVFKHTWRITHWQPITPPEEERK